ncbi:MAG: glycosyltransferase family 39 protein [Phycisphaerae bacterium]|nr:glycosyltransferase family 39 protein [Phycisphaerae bacterium]
MTARPNASLLGSRTLCWCVALYLLALGVRLVYYVQVRDNALYAWLTLDENTNHQAALARINGTMPPKAYLKAPLYLYYLVGVYKVFGADPGVARFIQVFLAALWAPLTFLIGERLFGRPAGVIAGLIAAGFWTFVFFSTELLDVAIGGVFYLLTACLLVRLPDQNRWKWLSIGIVMGFGAITRPNILAVAPFLAVAAFLMARRQASQNALSWLRSGLGRVLRLTLGSCLIILPVTIRNCLVGGEWVLIGAYGGVNFYLANNPEADAKNVELVGLPDYQPSNEYDANDPYNIHCFTYRSGCDFTSQRLGRPCTRGEMNDTMFSLGRDYVRSHPGKFATDCLKRVCWFFNAYEFADNKDLYQFQSFSSLLAALGIIHFGLLCPFMVLGTILALRPSARSAGMVYYMILLACLILPGAVFLTNARFRVTIVCLLAPLAAYAIVQILSWCRPAVERRRLFAAMACIAAVAVFSNANLFGYRPPCHPYLVFMYAAACGATGRADEMSRTVDRIEAAMAQGVEEGRHGRALYCLYDYYDVNGPLDKAVHYGQQLLEKRQLDANGTKRVFATFTKADRPDLIRPLLAATAQGITGADLLFLAEATMQYAERYRDHKALQDALGYYQRLAAQHPAELDYHRKIELMTRLLAAPASTTSRP